MLEIPSMDPSERDMPINSPFPVVCTSAWTPLVFANSDDQAEWSGFQIDYFRAIAAKLDWDPASWEFLNLGWGDMEEMLANGTCTIAAAGMDITTELLQSGLQASRPIVSLRRKTGRTN